MEKKESDGYSISSGVNNPFGYDIHPANHPILEERDIGVIAMFPTFFFVGIISVLVSFLLSFLIGVYGLYDHFIGNPYYGAIIYYAYFSIPVLVVFVLSMAKQIRALPIRSLFITSITTGFGYLVCSLVVNILYRDLVSFIPLDMNKFSLRHGLLLLIGPHGVRAGEILLVSVMLMLSIFLVGKVRRSRGVSWDAVEEG